MRPVVAALVVMLLALDLLSAAPADAAEPEASQPRTLTDAVVLSADANAYVGWAVGVTATEAARQGAAYMKLNLAKATQRELGRQYRRDRRAIRRSATGPERDCQLAALEQAHDRDRASLQQDIVGYRADLGYVDRRKGLTKLGNRLGKFARFVGGLVKETLTEAQPELLGALVAGPAGRAAIKVMLKRRFTRVAKNRVVSEALRRLAGVRSADILDHIVAECREAETAGDRGESSQQAPSGQVLNTGPFVVEGDVGFHEAFGRQGTAIMQWLEIAGEACGDFEAYNPHPLDPQNKKLPGIAVELQIHPDAGTYMGILKGPTKSTDLTEGLCDGFFVAGFEGKLQSLAAESGWELGPDQATVHLIYLMEAACGDLTEQWSVGPFWKVGGGSATVEGSIEPMGSVWMLELDVTHDKGKQAFWVELKELPLGPIYLPAPAVTDSSSTSSTSQPADSDEEAP